MPELSEKKRTCLLKAVVTLKHLQQHAGAKIYNNLLNHLKSSPGNQTLFSSLIRQ